MKFSVKDFFNKYEEFHSKKQPPQVFYAKRCSMQKGVLRNFAKFAGKTPVPEACNFIKKEILAQVFSCEFCEISKNIFFKEHL